MMLALSLWSAHVQLILKHTNAVYIFHSPPSDQILCMKTQSVLEIM